MALTKKTETKAENKVTLEVEKVREYNNNYFFNLIVSGIVTIYGCILRQSKNGDWFVCFPSKKGKDDKFYNIAYMNLTEEQTSCIISQIEKEVQ